MKLHGIDFKKIRHSKGYNGSRDPFYQTKEWKKLKVHFLACYPLCKRCEELGHVVKATVVDHILPRKQGGDSFAFSNLQGLCKEHNHIKTGLDNNDNLRY